MTHHGLPKHLVVGYDGLERSRNGVLAALDLRRRFGTVVDVLHVVDLPPLHEIGGRPDLVLQAEADIEARHYEQALAELKGLDPENELGLNDHLEVRVGKPARCLVDLAQERGADTILLGPHEKRGLLDFGSTTRGVIGSARCDLWMQPCPPRRIRRVLAPVDLSEESMRALAAARDLARDAGAELTALNVFQPPDLAYAASPGYPVSGPVYVIEDVRKLAEEEFRRALDDFDWGGVQHEARFVEGRPLAVILEQQEGHDLIAMGTHGRTGLAAAVLGNVAHGVLREAKVPVLALRHPQRTWQLD